MGRRRGVASLQKILFAGRQALCMACVGRIPSPHNDPGPRDTP